jgi:hypothetical protein
MNLKEMNPGDDDYLQAAKEVFARMSPEGRVRFGRYLGQKAQRQGHTFIDLNQDGIDDRLQDPNFLAQKTSEVHQEQPGLLSQLFGKHKRHRRRHGCHGGVHLLGPFEVEDPFESGEDDGGFFEGFFDGDFFGDCDLL